MNCYACELIIQKHNCKMEYYRNKIRNESYRIKTDERYELQKKQQQQQRYHA